MGLFVDQGYRSRSWSGFFTGSWSGWSKNTGSWSATLSPMIKQGGPFLIVSKLLQIDLREPTDSKINELQRLRHIRPPPFNVSTNEQARIVDANKIFYRYIQKSIVYSYYEKTWIQWERRTLLNHLSNPATVPVILLLISLRTCHLATGRRGVASISDQWRSSGPLAMQPSSTSPVHKGTVRYVQCTVYSQALPLLYIKVQLVMYSVQCIVKLYLSCTLRYGKLCTVYSPALPFLYIKVRLVMSL